MNPNKPEPPPEPGTGVPIWNLVIADVELRHPDTPARARFVEMARERDRHGRAHYGTPLTAKNGRNPMRDAIQESADKVVYLMQAVEEGYPVEAYYRREVADCMALIAILDQFHTP